MASFPRCTWTTKATRIKQYHKEGPALRTETTINNTRDFYIGKSLRNLPALRKIGFQANRRLLETESITHDCMLAEQTFQQLNLPRIVQEQRASALRFADPMVQAIWKALLVFDRLPTGFCNRDLRNNLAASLGQPVEHFTQGRMSYQGFRVAMFCTRTYARILRPGLGLVLPGNSSFPSALRRSFDKLEQQINSWVDKAKLAA